ncbi:MAG: bifunctional adenosylcobinamide kinase/adenosylcobinamide-phosphate guanylyltransferase [Mycobacterium sp.]|uniref:bifunctional adenosylcobinamide kinase/adenosylcobinamide-phosphate guanylyltransferase n=1 Tax=Mycobacterium sp. TaxID=1785 RepID=UPI0026113B1E|nr:bifunctional adenosylcobinamide kinase/adenosylcobinamide-phosphate guanylyltransferase [Mycobacterium sp.]MDI3313754.1 bifunctional adenosylcobinamide kinase/adenosylcobinamide-phosphate guanylyltransferase [Mycobacterium sp.]
MRILVLGGIRSGKSQWAEAVIAESLAPGQQVRYLATGQADHADEVWSARVAEHRARRLAHWSTVETDDVAAELRHSPRIPTLVDDVGTWLTAALDRHHAWDAGSVVVDIEELVAAVREFQAPLVLVSPEVGLSVVPGTASGRRFADELGMLNQRLAALCDRVVLVVAGQPVQIKPFRGAGS